MLIYDGTAWDHSLPLIQGLRARAEFGHGYRNESLEEKRRAAIRWLRTQPRGWVCDKVSKSPDPSFSEGEYRISVHCVGADK